MVADAISRKWSEARERERTEDGASWSVQPDWEASSGITNNIMQIRMAKEIEEQTKLRRQFADDPWLSEVVEALTGGDMQDIRTCRRARHWALNFSIQDGRLWCIRTKAKD